ncbi:MAG: RimK/LysX family protein [Rickettsiales bacterium]
MRTLFLLFTLTMLPLSPAHAGFAEWITGKKTLGWAEKVYVYDSDMTMRARIDTGAYLSSINASSIEIKDGATKSDPQRVTFDIINEHGEKQKVERELVRWAQIKKKGTAGYIKRPVVHLKMCIAGQILESEVTLGNRSRFIYPVLIGRNMLREEKFVVDSSERYTHKPDCGQ